MYKLIIISILLMSLIAFTSYQTFAKTYLPIIFNGDGFVFAIDGYIERVNIEGGGALIECDNNNQPTFELVQKTLIVQCN